jgi:hypothetical protein
MSSDEEDQAIGRLNRQYQDANRRLVALRGEASVLGKLMVSMGQALTFAKPSLTLFGPESLGKLNGEKILSLVTEIDTTWAEVETLKAQLQSVGLTPTH